MSLLAAKAVQDWPLYNGQETSTRFIDMAQQPIVDPVDTPTSHAVLDAWMEFYRSRQTAVRDHVRATHPRGADEDPKIYETAVQARSFDILRGFLPAGITTQLSWHTNLRQAGDHLIGLAAHPAAEVRALADGMKSGLGHRYPGSGFALNLPTVSSGDAPAKIDWEKAARRAAERAAWERACARWTTYLAPRHPKMGLTHTFDESAKRILHTDEIGDLVRDRPHGCVLPHFLSGLGHFTHTFLMDFGSFRDLQRHRNGVCRMPLLTTQYGFEPWYLLQLDPETRRAAERLVSLQAGTIGAMDASPVDKQYLTALGFRVAGSVTYGLPALVYVMELRSGKTIHPTLRSHVLDMIATFRAEFPMVPIHVDTDPDGWTVRRGRQTIARADGGAL